MPNFNEIKIIGHVGKDAEVKEISGKKVISFSVAYSEKRDNNESTTWFNVNGWGDRWEKVSQYVKKGTAVLVSGRFYLQTGKDGKSYPSININDLVLLGGKSSTDNTSTADNNTVIKDEIPF